MEDNHKSKNKWGKRKTLFFLGIALILIGTIGVIAINMTDNSEAIAENGDTVSVHYKGTLKDGTVFDSSEGRSPLTFTIGSGQVIQGFDSGVTGMAVGETKTVDIPVDQAYGSKDPGMIKEVPITDLSGISNVEVGVEVPLQLPTGQIIQGIITEVNDTNAVIDFNHKLAGEDLTFEITLVSIEGK